MDDNYSIIEKIIVGFLLVMLISSYQLLDDSWQTIAADLELLQTEGWECVREIEPNMVLKKKKDKDTGVETEVEIQDGWRGRIMPFELVQQLFLSDELEHKANLQLQIEELTSDIEDKLRELNDENREKYIDAETEKLDAKLLAADVKAMQKDPDLKDPELIELQRLISKQKETSKELKALETALIDLTCQRIKQLTDEEAYALLREKWIKPLCTKVFALPEELLSAIEKEVNQLIKRYSDTLLSVGQEIEKAEKELAGLLSELTGDEADMQAIQELTNLTGGFAVLEKLFPQNGQNTPSIRFKGFTDEWKEKNIGDAFKERDERSGDGELLSVTINSGIRRAIEMERTFATGDLNKYKVVKVGDIAYNTMRMWQGACGVSQYTGIVSPAYTIAMPQQNQDSVFYAYYFKTNLLLHEFRINSQGLTSDTWNLKYPTFERIRLFVPVEDEQRKIGSLFFFLDNLFSLRERQLTLLKHTKQALLEQMFVNE